MVQPAVYWQGNDEPQPNYNLEQKFYYGFKVLNTCSLLSGEAENEKKVAVPPNTLGVVEHVSSRDREVDGKTAREWSITVNFANGVRAVVSERILVRADEQVEKSLSA